MPRRAARRVRPRRGSRARLKAGTTRERTRLKAGATRERARLKAGTEGSGPPDDGHYEGSRALLKTGATGIRASESRRTGLTAGESPAGDGPVERFLRPEPRVRLGVLLGRNRAATACMDLSDGLADGLRGLARASGTGLSIDADALPIDREAHAWFEARGRDPVLEAVAGGDDYELLFTVSPRRQRRLRAVARLARGLTLTRIGVVTRDSALVLGGTAATRSCRRALRISAEAEERRLRAKGWGLRAEAGWRMGPKPPARIAARSGEQARQGEKAGALSLPFASSP